MKYLTKTNVMAVLTICTAVASAVGVEVPTEIFIGEGGLIALFIRLGMIKIERKI
jgi:hypothetical protein